VFLSYRGCDAEVARELAAALECAGFVVWHFDGARNMPLDRPYIDVVRQQIASSKLFICIFSTKSLKGNQKEVLAEIHQAWTRYPQDIAIAFVLADLTFGEWQQLGGEFVPYFGRLTPHQLQTGRLTEDCIEFARKLAAFQGIPTADLTPEESKPAPGVRRGAWAHFKRWVLTHRIKVIGAVFGALLSIASPLIVWRLTELASMGACCLPDGACVVVIDSDCQARNGEFKGRQTPCHANLCATIPPIVPPPDNGNENDAPRPIDPPPTMPAKLGACCFQDGRACAQLAQDHCEGQGGVFQGSNTECADVTCPVAALGACCLTDCTCEILSQQECAARGGRYEGDNTDCARDTCLPVMPAIQQGAGCHAYLFVRNEHDQNIGVMLENEIRAKLGEVVEEVTVRQNLEYSTDDLQFRARCAGRGAIVILTVQLLRNGEVNGALQSRYSIEAALYAADGSRWRRLNIESAVRSDTLNAVNPGADPPISTLEDQFKYLLARTAKTLKTATAR
jgi:hypothetical protein